MAPLLTAPPTPQFAGATTLRSVFSPDEMTSARYGQERFMAGEWDREPEFAWRKPTAKQSRSWKTPYATWFRSELAALARSPRLLAGIAEATQARTIRFWFDQLLWEAPATTNKPLNYHWHAERSRWKTSESRLMVTAWVPLCRMTPALGPITFVQGSERRRWVELPDGWEPEHDDLSPTMAQPGDAALFCWHTVHGNPQNRGERPRRAIALHFAIDELNYQPHGRFHHLNERFVRRKAGRPDFTDERVCPVVWGTAKSAQEGF